jgi:hypothetical protein
MGLSLALSGIRKNGSEGERHALGLLISGFMERATSPPPSRQREDDKVVEVFLNVYEQGRFSYDPEWLPQHERNVEVIATANDGTRLAIEHTRIFAFDGHQKQEVLLRPIAASLKTISLPPSAADRFFVLLFPSNFMGRQLQRHRALVIRELVTWAEATLPRDDHLYHFDIPTLLPNGTAPAIGLDVKVFGNVKVSPQVSIGGWLPQGERLTNGVKQALRNKLPKLVDAKADRRFLMIDMPTHTDSDISVVNIIRETVSDFPLLLKIDQIVFAKTFGFRFESTIFFRMWNPKLEKWSDYIHASVT